MAESECSGGGLMNTLQNAKKRYEEIEIPEELSVRISEEIARADKRRWKGRLSRRRVKNIAAAAAAAAVVFTTALNTSTAFAESVGELPVIGAVARVLTFRSYETSDEDLKISVEIPTIEMIETDMKGLAQSVNQEILKLCEQYAQEARTRAEEYRKAFLETGGTEEEWARHNIQISVWYEVKAQTDKYLSLAIMGTESWTTAYSETRYYNLDLENGKLFTLEDVLGADYKQIADEEIRRQMKERADSGSVYFEGFEGIDENTPFYLKENGNPVIVFDKYEIAPGSEGQQEFEIQKAGKSSETEKVGFNELSALLGKKDSDTANLLGGGEENWTEDHSFYIGRNYQVSLFGSPCKVFSTCGNEQTVESVSLWIVSGERSVTQEEADQWAQRVTDFMGVKPSYDEGISEGGSRNRRWNANGVAVSMNQMADILTISFQPAVGEII